MITRQEVLGLQAEGCGRHHIGSLQWCWMKEMREAVWPAGLGLVGGIREM